MNKKILNRKENGITLIALVITIIVLLILAGVAISMLSGENGILKKAADAKEKTEAAQKQEETTLTDYELISHFTLNNSKYKCKYGYITGVTTTENELTESAELASNLVKALPEGYSLYEIDKTTLETTGDPISLEDEETILKTGMAITKDKKIVAKVVVFGDIDGNGTVVAMDRTIFYRFLSSEGTTKKFPEDETFYIAMDMNHDGIIDSIDYDILNNTISSYGPDNPIVTIQNKEAKKIEEIIFTEI